MFHVPEKYRITKGSLLASSTRYGHNGAFEIGVHKPERRLLCIASDGEGWEHVSVSVFDGLLSTKQNRCPTWEEMCLIKSLFWDEDDCVIEYHPAKSEYISCHPYCLHLWRPVGIVLPIPPKEFVGSSDFLK